MDMTLVIQLVAGALGGNAAGAVLNKLNLGTLGNSVSGLVGGGLGGQILGLMGGAGMGAAAHGMDITSIIASVAVGGAGGGALMAIVGAVKNMMSKT